MQKFNTSCGLTNKQIGIIKFAIKNAMAPRLPLLPENVETRLFFKGREAWIYSWQLCEQDALEPLKKILVEVIAKLKKEFHQYKVGKQYTFLCKVQIEPNIYQPKVSIRKKNT